MQHNAKGHADSLITFHDLYLALGRTIQSRQNAYKSLFKMHMAEDTIKKIRAAWQTGTPLGNDRFRDKIERALKLKVGHPKQGRPRKDVL